MRKILKMIDLDCAHCADKMERAISKISDVNSVSINFMAQKMVIDIEDEKFNETMQLVAKACADIEPDCKIIL